MVEVSVVVPIYNAEATLRQCLDSIVHQSLKDLEIILINDGSSDGSERICQEYLSDARVMYYRKENEGLAAARQDGLELAHGRYIGFVDSDDWLELDTYERMLKAAEVNQADIVFCNCVQNEDGHRFSPEMPSGPYDREGILREILPRTLAYVGKQGEARAIRWSNCLRIYKLDRIRQEHIVFDRRFRRSQDLQFTYEATLHAQSYYYLGNDYLYHNRVVSGSLSRGYTKRMWYFYSILIKRLYDLTESFSELNLMPQAHLRNFFFVVSCIDNELKKEKDYSPVELEAAIMEIMDDPLARQYEGCLPLEQLSPLLRGYYRYILKQDPRGLVAFIHRYGRHHEAWMAFKRKMMHFLTESRGIGDCYKFLFHR